MGLGVAVRRVGVLTVPLDKYAVVVVELLLVELVGGAHLLELC